MKNIKNILVVILAFCMIACSSHEEPIDPQEPNDEIIPTISLSYTEALKNGLSCTSAEEAQDKIGTQSDTLIYLPIEGGKIEIPLKSLGEISGITKSDGHEVIAIDAKRTFTNDCRYIPSEPDVYIFNPYLLEANRLRISHVQPYMIEVEVTENYAYREYQIGICKTNVTPKGLTDFYDIFERDSPLYICRIRLQ